MAALAEAPPKVYQRGGGRALDVCTSIRPMEEPMHRTSPRLLPAALVGAVAALALAAGPAAAAKPIVHPTPKVPVVVDGKRLAPKQIHRYDGRALYTRMSADGKTLIATTELAKFKTFLARKGLTLPAAGPAKARTSAAGHWARICTDNFLRGHCHTVSSGHGVANMAAVSGCNWFTCWNFENSVSSLETYGRAALLYDLSNFNSAWGTHYAAAGQQQDLAVFGFNDRLSSVFTYW
jgi:hypothetical protein